MESLTCWYTEGLEVISLVPNAALTPEKHLCKIATNFFYIFYCEPLDILSNSTE